MMAANPTTTVPGQNVCYFVYSPRLFCGHHFLIINQSRTATTKINIYLFLGGGLVGVVDPPLEMTLVTPLFVVSNMPESELKLIVHLLLRILQLHYQSAIF